MNFPTVLIPFSYVGPGAGFAFFSTFLVLILSAIVVFATVLVVPFKWTRKFFRMIIPVESVRYLVYVAVALGLIWLAGSYVVAWWSGPAHPRFVVLGMDGLDPDIVRDMASRGELPNFKRLMERGELQNLKVPNPPISPTSWASFITGSNPGRHGVLGFIGRDPETYGPELFTTIESAEMFLNLPSNLNIPGSYNIPLAPPNYTSKRQGTPFWEITSEQGITSTMIKVPVTFPPEQVSGRMISGLGAPDLKGTQGSYSFWTEDPPSRDERSSGNIHALRFINDSANSSIEGPTNTLLDRPKPTRLKLNLERSADTVLIKIDRVDEFALKPGEWSEWKKLRFPLGLGMNVTGVVRFHLNQLDPLELYMTPIQINPKDPVMAISHPESYSNHLAKRIGFYYTMGMAQDDKALKEENISDTVFLEQAYQ
ncbi:MAG: alkaline phosphatase family protein, partial [bacterium]